MDGQDVQDAIVLEVTADALDLTLHGSFEGLTLPNVMLSSVLEELERAICEEDSDGDFPFVDLMSEGFENLHLLPPEN